jgi:hypothetical protein
MSKYIIKYFFLCILPVNLLFAQENGLHKDFSGNNISVDKTEFMAYQSLINPNFGKSNEKIKPAVTVENLYKVLQSLLKVNHNVKNEDVRKPLNNYIFRSGYTVNSHERPEEHSNRRPDGNSFENPDKNLLTSISENIEIGGISREYALVSFVPKLSIEPLNFISISANQNVRYLIPVKAINEHLQLLFFQSVYIVAIDKFVALFSNTYSITKNIIGFIAKNFISSFFSTWINNDSKDKVYSITTYNYAIKIKL